MKSLPKVNINILSYNSQRYIRGCIESVLNQIYPNIEILIIITGSDDGSAEFINSTYTRNKKIKIVEPGENLWFSRGHNLGIAATSGDYVLALNQDIIMEPDFVSKLVAYLESNPTLGSVSGKLLHYNYTINSKTRIIDSTGIEMFRTRRVIDRGQWERDDKQYDFDLDIFGASGAAALYRRSALEAIKLPKINGEYEYFDEDFVAYKEDIDLSWRLQLAGFGCKYIPEAIIYHGRTVGRSWPNQLIRFIVNRRRQSRLVRRMAFKNHYLMMIKCELPNLFWRQFGFIFVREFLLLVYTVIFEPFQFWALGQLRREIPEAVRKRKLIMQNVKVAPEALRKLFH